MNLATGLIYTEHSKPNVLFTSFLRLTEKSHMREFGKKGKIYVPCQAVAVCCGS